MSTYSYAYTRPDGTWKHVAGFASRKEAAIYLGHSLHDNGYATRARAQKIARAARDADSPCTDEDITASIIPDVEEAHL